jgi:hypothetical protein
MIDKAITDKFSELRGERLPYEATWEDLAKYFHPYREDLFNNKVKGLVLGRYLYDPTGVSAVRMLAEGLFGYLMSPAIDWFRLEISDNENPDVTLWLESVVKGLYAALRRSNFYSEIVEFLTDGITFGTGVLYHEENLEDGTIFYKVISPGCVWVDEDAYGRVRTIFRRDTYSLAQAQSKFKNCTEEGRFIHVVMPDGDRWKSTWYHEKSGKIVRKGKYEAFPYIVWRCIKNPQSAYGFSPALMALPSVKTLNKIRKTLLEAALLSVKPPLNVPAEADVDLTPNGINYYDNPNDIIKPVNLGIDFPIGREREEVIQKSVRDFFNIDFFLMFAHQERAMTATEVVGRQGEKAAILGNMVGRLTGELLDSVIEGAYGIEYRAGRLTELPETLKDQVSVDIEYLGPLAVAQKKLFQSKGLNHALEEIAPILELKPETSANIDWDYLVRYAYEVAGAPAKGLKDKDDVEEKRLTDLMTSMAQAEMGEGMGNDQE